MSFLTWKLAQGRNRPRGRTLVYQRCEWRAPKARFLFRHGTAVYAKTLTLDADVGEAVDRLDAGTRGTLLGHLGLAYAPQLFGLEDFAKVRVRALAIEPAGRDFFATVFRHGLAELRFRNSHDPAAAIDIEVDPEAPRFEASAPSTDDHALLLNGGGKDSAVAGELLRGVGLPFTWLLYNPAAPMRRVIEASGTHDVIAVKMGGSAARYRADRRLRGHRPFNQILAFLGLLVAAATGRRYIVAANERSADIPTLTTSRGIEVNHQYTKSGDFERRFTAYAATVLPGIHYFSALRPLHELAIAGHFASHPQYLPHFVSCNRGLYDSRWCRTCSKCAFVWLVLRAFLDDRALAPLFGDHPLRNDAFHRHVTQLVRARRRPFECVGTLAESRVALALALRRGLDPDVFTPADRADAEKALGDEPHLLQPDVSAAGGLPERWRDDLLRAMAAPPA